MRMAGGIALAGLGGKDEKGFSGWEWWLHWGSQAPLNLHAVQAASKNDRGCCQRWWTENKLATGAEGRVFSGAGTGCL